MTHDPRPDARPFTQVDITAGAPLALLRELRDLRGAGWAAAGHLDGPGAAERDASGAESTSSVRRSGSGQRTGAVEAGQSGFGDACRVAAKR